MSRSLNQQTPQLAHSTSTIPRTRTPPSSSTSSRPPPQTQASWSSAKTVRSPTTLTINCFLPRHRRGPLLRPGRQSPRRPSSHQLPTHLPPLRSHQQRPCSPHLVPLALHRHLRLRRALIPPLQPTPLPPPRSLPTQEQQQQQQQSSPHHHLLLKQPRPQHAHTLTHVLLRLRVREQFRLRPSKLWQVRRH